MAYEKHDVITIEGIGVKYAKALRKLGIYATEDMLLHSYDEFAKLMHVIDQLSRPRAKALHTQASLLQINGLNEQHAEVIMHDERRTLWKFAETDPDSLEKEFQEAFHAGKLKKTVDLKTIIKWQKTAFAIHYSPSIAGKVTSGGEPIAGAVVYHGFDTALTDSRGTFWMPVALQDINKLIIKAKGFKRFVTMVELHNTETKTLNFELEKGRDKPRSVDESKGERIRNFDPDDEIKFYDAKLEAQEDGTPFQFREWYANGDAKLIGIFRKRTNNQILVARMRVAKNQVRKDAAPQDIYRVKEGKLKPSKKESVLSIRTY